MLNVTKRDGTLEPINIDKINKWVEWACEGTNASWSDIATRAQVFFYEGIPTSDIQTMLIKACEHDINPWDISNLRVAAKLLLSDLRKKVYGEYTPHSILDQIWFGQTIGIYDTEPAYNLLDQYSHQDFEELEDIIDHSRDELHPYCGLQTLVDKYLCQNRATGQIYETPQMMYMLIAMTAAIKYQPNIRIARVKSIYDKLSTGKANLPTPVAGGMRTPLRQFASCCLIDIDDTMPSIGMSDHAAFIYTGARAGLGLNYGRIRREGSSIRHGEVRHTGIVPFLKKSSATTKSCTQNGLRGGGANVNFPLWHYDFKDLVVLKDIKGTEDNRVRTMDYCFHYNKYLVDRMLDGKVITFFSPNQVKDLYKAFYSPNINEFAALYEKYEKDDTVDRWSMDGRAVFTMLVTQMLGTGRIYTLDAYEVNHHTSFYEPIVMTNLCVEITLPTTPIVDINDVAPINPYESEGEIALCVLGGIPWGNIELEEMYDIVYDQLDLLDTIFDMQMYVIKAAEHAKYRRSVGIGVIDYAHFLAKRDLRYGSPEALNITHRWMEHMQFCLIKASIEIAKDRGACGYNDRTKWADGILPIDHYNKNVDELHTQPLMEDWESLREPLKTWGMRFSTLTAHMPSESSSVVWGFTNGIEPVRKPITVKSSKKGDLIVPAPDIESLGLAYTYCYSNEYSIGITNDEYLATAAIIQKFSCQSISFNRYYNFSMSEDGEPMVDDTELLEDCIVKPMYYGIKTGYYTNSNVVENIDSGCAGGGCTI